MRTTTISAGIAPILLLCGHSAVAGESTSPQDIEAVRSSLSQVQQTSATPPCDPTDHDLSQPACSKLSDQVCAQLWSPAHKGNMKVSGGRILLGNSNKSEISESQKQDIEALLDSESRLPADLRKKGAPILAKLRQVMAKENDSKSWYRNVNQILREWWNAVSDTADARAEKEFPELKRIKHKDLSVDQLSRYQSKTLDLKDEILRAKYADSLNWKRVQRVFGEVKSDLLAEIQTLDIPEEQRKRMYDKVKPIELSLPFPDPRIIGADDNCAATEVNAFYSPDFNKFTVCAGYFNTFQNDASMYLVLAHEMSHSIDPVDSALSRYEEGPVGKLASEFSFAKGPVFSCDDWKKIRRGPLALSDTVKEPDYPYRTLTDCLVPIEGLRPFNGQTVLPVVQRSSGIAINAYATGQNFTKLAQPTMHNNDGKIVPNEFYMRPDRLIAADNDFVFPTTRHYGASIPAIFVQSLSCQTETVDGRIVHYDQAPENVRAGIFEQAIKETKDVTAAIIQATLSECGRECANLVSDGISRNAQEAFADWLATQTFPRYLSRQDSIDRRRDTAGLSWALFCDAPGPESDAPLLTIREKMFSYEPHPDNRNRRLSLFTAEVAKVLGCRRGQDVRKGFGSCHL